MKIVLDKFDYDILRILNENARLSYAEIGRKISLSQSATKERVLNLIDNEVIKNFNIEIDYKKLGYSLTVIISLKFKNDEYKKFINNLSKFPEVINCKRITGEYCILIECILNDSYQLEGLIDRLIPYGTPTTSVKLSEMKVPKVIPKSN